MISKIAEFESAYKVEQYKKMQASKKAQSNKMQKVNTVEGIEQSKTIEDDKHDNETSLFSKYILNYYNSLPIRLKIEEKT